MEEERGLRVPRSKGPKVHGSQGPLVPRSMGPKVHGFKGPRNLKFTFKYELDSKEGPSCFLNFWWSFLIFFPPICSLVKPNADSDSQKTSKLILSQFYSVFHESLKLLLNVYSNPKSNFCFMCLDVLT